MLWPFFFENCILDSTSARGGYLEFLPSLYDSALAQSCLKESTKAVLLVSLANASSMNHVALRAREHYGRALSSLMVALNSEAEAKCDEVFTTLVLLQKFEVGILAVSQCALD
jgi:hypothetical protein